MEFIIILITSIVLATTLIAYFVTKGQPPMESFMEGDKKEEIIVTSRITKQNSSPELKNILESSEELSKQLDEFSKIPAFMESLHNASQPSLEEVLDEHTKKKYQPKSPRVKK